MPMEGGKPWPNGMYSRRHKTSEAHSAAVAEREARVAEQEAASLEREEAARNRTPQEQIKRLDSLLGKGKGARKERARLALKIEAQKELDKQAAHKASNKAKKKG